MDNSKILFTGGNGHLCSNFKNVKNSNFIFLNKNELDIRNIESIDDSFSKYEFDYVIHSAAITRPMKNHETNPLISIDTNIIGTANLVKKCVEYNKKLIYISTDYVYGGGDGNYCEESPVLPPNNYGWSKLGGECSVNMISSFLILRIAMVEYPFPHEYAFSDVLKSAIWSDDLPYIVLSLKDERGIYNIGGPTNSIYTFVKSRNLDITPINSDNSIPKNITMNLTKLNNYFENK